MSDNNNNKALNTGRQFEIDLVRAACIVVMIIYHVFEMVTTARVEPYLLKLAVYYAGNTLTGLFIICMGIGIVYTTHGTPASFAKRGIKLLLQGHLLVFCNAGFMILISRKYGQMEDPYSVFTTEILAFAGLVFLLTALLTKLKCKSWHFFAVAGAFQVIAAVLSGAFDDSPLAVRYLVGTLFYPGSPDISSFPLFPFFIYAAFGMLYGEMLKRTANKRLFYLRSAFIGTTVCLIASVIYKIVGFNIVEASFYDAYHASVFPAAIWYISQAAVWIAIAYPVSLLLKGKAKNAVGYLSRNITNIYVFQWILFQFLFWFMFHNEISCFSSVAGVPLSAGFLLVSIALSKCWTTVNNLRHSRTKTAIQKDRQYEHPDL